MKTILFCSWNVVGEEDMIDALQKNGFQVQTFCEPIDSVDYDLVYINKLSAQLDQCRTEYVFSDNYIPAISRVCQIYHIPYVSWVVDCPLIMLFSETVGYSCNYIFLFDWNMYETHKHKNPGHIFYMPLGANVERMDQISFGNAEWERYQADVGFLGSLYVKRSKYNLIEQKLSPYMKGFAMGLIEAQCLVYGQNFLTQSISEETAERFFKEAGIAPVGEDYAVDKREIVGGDILSVKCSQLERVRLLNAIADKFPLDLYTKEDANLVPKARHRGTADYFLQMPQIFRATKINLNFTSRSIQTGLPLRIFDIMGAGGFLLTNYQPELQQYFEIGTDLAVYESEQDLLAQVEYYLHHEDERKAIAENGYNKIKESMQMRQRIEDMFSYLRNDD